jgi:hypothetical protein
VIQLLQHKHQVKAALESFVNRMETRFEKKVKAIQSDRGGEFWNKEIDSFCRTKGIVHRKTNPYSSLENGVAERLNMTLMEKTRALLEESHLGKEFWGEAVLTVNYTRTVSTVHGKTPLEVLTGKRPKVDNLRVFGVKAFVHVPNQKRKKLDAVSEKGTFLGYEPETKGYRILRERDGVVIVSKDVTFEETPRSKTILIDLDEESGESALPKDDGLDELGGARDLSRVSPLDSPSAGATPTGEASASDDPVPEGEKGREAPSKRVRKPSTRYPETEWQRANLAKEKATGHIEPQSYEEALASPDAELWQKAMDEEMASLLENQTWSTEPVPEGVKPVPVKWVYKIKTDENGNIERFKARVCAKGYKQQQGVDFEEVFAPVSRQSTVRALLTIAAVRDLEVEQLDVKIAFLNGDLEEEIWMEQPKGYEVGGKETACHLKKALYGLKQAPRAWHLKLTQEMGKLGFVPSTADPALFTKKTEEETTYAAVWVDDCLVVGEEESA